MNGFIRIRFDEKKESYKLESAQGYYDCDYIFMIELTSPKLYKDIVADKKKINKYLLKDYNKNLVQFEDEFAEEIEINKKYFDNQFDLFSDSNYIEIDASFAEVSDYLKLNPELKMKKILFANPLDLEYTTLLEVKKYLGGVNNVYFKVDGNNEAITIEDYEKTVNKIQDILMNIKQYNYSPFERVLHAYDLVRDKQYKEEDIVEKVTVSRDLTSALLGDKIVCGGYANIFKSILNHLGLSAIVHKLNGNGETSNHAIVLAYIKDDKYDIEGVYDFDVTADSKKNDNNFFNKYAGFAKTRAQMMNIYHGKFSDDTFSLLSTDLVTCFENCYNEYGIEGILDQLLKPINKLSNLIEDKPLLDIVDLIYADQSYIDKIIDYLGRYDIILNHMLDADIFLEMLYNVRKNEYYEIPSKYPFSMNAFHEALEKSNFAFKDDAIINMFQEMFNISIVKSMEDLNNKIGSCMDKFNLEEKVLGVTLAKSLKLVYEKEKNNL